MSNQNYAQVTDLLDQGKLLWATDPISALLVHGAVFNDAHTRLSELGAQFVSSVPIQGRFVAEDAAMGLPAAFQYVTSGQIYQVLVAQNDGNPDPRVLSFMDEDTDGNPITVQRSGSLIIRPSQENLPVPPDQMEPAPTTGFWMRLV